MLGLVVFFLEAIILVVIADAVLSWFQKPNDMPRRLTRQLMEPVYAPIHAIVDPRKTGGMDLSPIFLIVILRVIISALS